MTRLLLLVQSVYYVATGLWSLINIDSFQAVTGPKTDTWLVKTVGILVMAIGAVIGVSALRRRLPAETKLLSAGSALGLAAIDTVYVSRGRISRVYLFDAAAEALGLILLLRHPRS